MKVIIADTEGLVKFAQNIAEDYDYIDKFIDPGGNMHFDITPKQTHTMSMMIKGQNMSIIASRQYLSSMSTHHIIFQIVWCACRPSCQLDHQADVQAIQICRENIRTFNPKSFQAQFIEVLTRRKGFNDPIVNDRISRFISLVGSLETFNPTA
jgi:hypothetical protein